MISLLIITPAQAMVIGSGISAAGGLITNWINRKNLKDTNKQRDDIYREQMAYNSESAQMQRRMAAGLHPMTMAGSQPTEAPTAPDFESFEATNPFRGAIDTGTQVAQSMLQQKELSLRDKSLDVDKLATSAQIANVVGSLVEKGMSSYEITDLFQKVGILNVGESISNIEASTFNLKLIQQNVVGLEKDNALKQKNIEWFDRIQQMALNVQQSHIDVNETVKMVNASIAKLNDTKRREAEQAIKNMKQQLALMVQQTTVASYEANKASAMMKYIREDTELLHNILTKECDLTRLEADTFIWQLVSSFLGNISPNVGFIKKF